LVDGNGAAAVILKRLSDAIADGDHIHAVILGSAINNDGSDKIGYSAPSIDGQAEVILEAQAMAGVSPEDISYVEAHGTATPLGDPIEVAALTQAFRTQTDRKGYCGLGAVKSNIGHVDKAAGLAGLIKTALSLEHEQLVPTLHWQAPNPKLDLPNTPFYVVNTLKPWPRRANKPRIAALRMPMPSLPRPLWRNLAQAHVPTNFLCCLHVPSPL
jgi:acyl transferase domain-containing protein